jgi:hypothetical protein
VVIVAVKLSYGASLLATPNPAAGAAVIQGRHLAVGVLACAVAAAAIRYVLALRLDTRLDRFRVPESARTHVRRFAWGGLVVSGLLAIVVLHGAIAREYHGFMSEARPGSASDLRARLADPGNNGRIDQWRVAWHEFQRAPIFGQGAGTFENTWAKNRPNVMFVVDAHSLYLETLDELGITGFMLLVGTIGGILAVSATRLRGPNRALYAAAFSILLIWALHAGIDWDWEMPAVTLPFFALGAFMLSRSPRTSDKSSRSPVRRARRAWHGRAAVGLGSLLVAVLPAYLWVSQRHLDQATTAFAARDCTTATRSALAAISILGGRPEPYEVVGYCDVRSGRPRAAIPAIQKAISLDPENWNFHYDLAVVRASAGLDPRAAIGQAVELDPRERLVLQAVRVFRRGGRKQWQRDGSTIAAGFTSL